MAEFSISLSERLLIIMHNLCATSAGWAKRSDELAHILQADVSEVNRILERHVSEGYVESFLDNEGNKRYYLSSKGIIRVCSLFS